jgi:hypothetical protein
MIFIRPVHKFDDSSSGVTAGIFTEDLTEVDYFKTILPDRIVNFFTTETIKYAHQAIYRYVNDNLPYSLKR